MPFCGKNRGNQEIDLEAVISFLYILLCMTAGIAAMTVIGMLFASFREQNVVMYQMTLAVNALTLFFGGFALQRLRNKKRKLEEKMNKKNEIEKEK